MIDVLAVLLGVVLALGGLCVLDRVTRERSRNLPPARSREFPRWSEQMARGFLAGGSCKWE